MYTNSCESEKTHSMRIWRNWQTRTVQVRVNIVFVEVRILLSAPNKNSFSNRKAVFILSGFLRHHGNRTFFVPFDTFLIKVWNITRNRFLCPLIYNPFSIIMRI